MKDDWKIDSFLRWITMSAVTPQLPGAPPGPPEVPPVPIWRITVEQYHEMIRSGIIDENDPVELLEGWLVWKMAKNPPHVVATWLVRRGLETLVTPGWFVHSQEPVTTEDSEPEPDISALRGAIRDYLSRHPFPSDSLLVVEVSDSTLHHDRTFKKRVYARARIPVYWIVNLVDRQIEVYADPSGPGPDPDYRQHTDYRPGDQVPVVIDGREIGRLSVNDLLP
jgi:Uma2 family endonuclease